MERVAHRYAAFASYAARIDIALVRDVENFLEGLDKNRLIDERYRRKLELCRDGSDFTLPRRGRDDPAGDRPLLDIIRGYLRLSAKLVVFVGAESREHPWLRAELDMWLAERDPKDVLVCLTHGDDRDRRYDLLFPPAVVEHKLHEPYYFDLRGFQATAKRTLAPRPYEEERVRLAAALMEPGVSAAHLAAGWRLAAARARCQRRIIYSIAAAGGLTLAGAALIQTHRSETARLLGDAQVLARTQPTEALLALAGMRNR